MLDLLFDPKDEGDTTLCNVDGLLPNYMALQQKKIVIFFVPPGTRAATLHT
jgi:hypothetical protein